MKYIGEVTYDADKDMVEVLKALNKEVLSNPEIVAKLYTVFREHSDGKRR